MKEFRLYVGEGTVMNDCMKNVKFPMVSSASERRMVVTTTLADDRFDAVENLIEQGFIERVDELLEILYCTDGGSDGVYMTKLRFTDKTLELL